MSAMYKAIATDLDGTLLNSDHQLDPYTIDTVRRLAGSGVPFVIATGATMRMSRVFATCSASVLT